MQVNKLIICVSLFICFSNSNPSSTLRVTPSKFATLETMRVKYSFNSNKPLCQYNRVNLSALHVLYSSHKGFGLCFHTEQY